MLPKYLQWIDNKLAKENPNCKCLEWVKEMFESFPELQPIRGNIMLSNGWDREHCWLITDTGEIIDPSESQYMTPYYGFSTIIKYNPYDESLGEPSGLCLCCLKLCYDGDSTCSEQCYNEFVTSLIGTRIGAEQGRIK